MLQGRDSPSVAAVTQGRGERLLGVMLVRNAILRLGEGEKRPNMSSQNPKPVPTT